jgi:dihydrofolate reductase
VAKLIYNAIASLDGFIEDAEGKFDWATPDDEVHAFVNELQRPIGTYLLGRRMYETLLFWESPPGLEHQPTVVQEFAEIWKGVDKVVYSRTLSAPSSARTRLEHDFDVEAVRRVKEAASHDLTVGGPELAGQAIAAGLVDELELFLVPVLVGGGKRALPDNGVRMGLDLLDERRFGNGTAYVRYRLRP